MPSMNSPSAALANRGPRACSTCAKAKARCIPGPDATKCERCHRLNKPCGTQVPAPPRPRKTPRPTRVAELEKRLEDLTSRLESSQSQSQSQSQSSQTRQAPSPPTSDTGRELRGFMVDAKGGGKGVHSFTHLFPEIGPLDVGRPGGGSPDTWASRDALSAGTRECQSSSSISGGAESSATSTSTRLGSQPVATPSTLVTPDSSPATELECRPLHLAAQTPITSPPAWPEGEEAEAFLKLYRTQISDLFPFAIVPPHMTAAELKAQKPFFWKAVMMEACHLNGPRQQALGDELLKDIALATIVQPKRSLDLLQGLQILLALYNYNLNSFQMTNLLFLCRSICLGLGFTESQSSTKQKEHTSGCLEQMRAFAGTYYLVTVVFTTNKKPDAFMNTAYLEACCSVLESKREYPTDELLVWLVRAQQLTQTISMALTLRGSSVQAIELPLTIVIKSFKQQLENFRSSLPLQLRGNMALKGHVAIAEILLYEIGLSESSGLPITDQLEFLWACVAAAKNFFANRFAELPGEFPSFICMSSFDLIYAFLTSLKLITFEAPGWDRRIIRRELAFDQLLARQARDMEAMAELRSKMGHLRENDPLQRLTAKVKCLSQYLQENYDSGDVQLNGLQGVIPAMAPATPAAPTPAPQDPMLVEVGEVTLDIMQDLETVFWAGTDDFPSFDHGGFADWTY